MTKSYYFHREQVAHSLYKNATALITDSFAQGMAAQSWGDAGPLVPIIPENVIQMVYPAKSKAAPLIDWVGSETTLPPHQWDRQT